MTSQQKLGLVLLLVVLREEGVPSERVQSTGAGEEQASSINPDAGKRKEKVVLLLLLQRCSMLAVVDRFGDQGVEGVRMG